MRRKPNRVHRNQHNVTSWTLNDGREAIGTVRIDKHGAFECVLPNGSIIARFGCWEAAIGYFKEIELNKQRKLEEKPRRIERGKVPHKGS